VGSGGSAYVDGGIFAMVQGFGGFRAFRKNGEEIEMGKLRPDQIKEIDHLEVAS
jgi:glycerate kinase